MDINEKNIVELYKKEAESNDKKSLKGYLADPNFSDIPEEIKNLSLGLWNPLRHETIVPKIDMKILDIGCGSGMDLYYLFKKYPELDYYGIDLCYNLLKKGEKIYEERSFKPRFINSNITSIPIKDNSIDFILAHAVIHLSPKKKEIFDECSRVLKNGGTLMICDPMIKGNMPALMQKEYNDTKGIFIYGGLLELDDYKRLIEEAGFSYFDHIEQIEFDPTPTIKMLLKRKFGKLDLEFENELDQLDFYIETFEVVKGNGYGKRKIKCKKCGFDNIINYRSVINSIKEKEYDKMLFNYKLNITKCEKCGALIDCPEPFLYISRYMDVYNKMPLDYSEKDIDIDNYFPEELKPQNIFDPDEFIKKITPSIWKRLKFSLLGAKKINDRK